MTMVRVSGLLLASGVLAWWPVLACAASAPKVLEGPLADAVRKGIASGTRKLDHGGWDRLLAAHVDGQGKVDYQGMAKDRAALDAYLAEVARADPASLGRAELLAFLINAYNACTVRLILDSASTGTPGGRWPASIRDLPDPWSRKRCTLGGETVSLDAIEHGLLRPLFRDPRIHAAVNCASRSCPVLAARAYRGEGVLEHLEERMAALVNDPAHLRVEGGRLRLSKIFDWYGGDFVDGSFAGSARTVAEYVGRFARPELRRSIEALGPRPRVEFLDYDWSLNGR